MSKHTFNCPKCGSMASYPLPEAGKIFCMGCNYTFVCATCIDMLERMQAPHEEKFRNSELGKRMTE